MIKAECIAASICKTKIATFKVTMPRFILAEFNTHRMFSRNSASSRAIPLKKMVETVLNDPFIPIAWQKDHKGMQGTEYFTNPMDIEDLIQQHLSGRSVACAVAQILHHKGVTKQICNRYLEPFMWHTVLVTATEWENFFHLRCPQYGGIDARNQEVYFKSKKDALKHLNSIGVNTNNLSLNDTLGWLKVNKGQADIHMMAVAEAIYDAWNEADFKQLAPYEWHVPFGDQIDLHELTETLYKLAKERFLIKTEDLMQAVREVSVARCARLSYQTLGDDPKINYEADLKLYNDLRRSGHWSPFEHVAYAMDEDVWRSCLKTIINSEGNFQVEEGWLANFRGWVQTRTILENKV